MGYNPARLVWAASCRRIPHGWQGSSGVSCPHRLVAQDGALSRLKPEFESPWGHTQVIRLMALFLFKPESPLRGGYSSLRGTHESHPIDGSFFVQTGAPLEGVVFEVSGPVAEASQGAYEFIVANKLFSIAGYTSGVDK